MNDISKIHKRMDKMQGLCEKNFQNKLFLLCVKNNTNQIENFTKEDRNEYQFEQEKIKNYLTISVIKQPVNGKRRDTQHKKTKPLKRISQISSRDLIQFRIENRKDKNYMIFRTADEFKNG